VHRTINSSRVSISPFSVCTAFRLTSLACAESGCLGGRLLPRVVTVSWSSLLLLMLSRLDITASGWHARRKGRITLRSDDFGFVGTEEETRRRCMLWMFDVQRCDVLHRLSAKLTLHLTGAALVVAVTAIAVGRRDEAQSEE
jgi:hypothetical protein